MAVNIIGESEPSKPSLSVLTLMEVPVGKPVVTNAYGVGSSSIRLHWVPPSQSTIYGEFSGYRITFRFRDKPEEKKVIVIRDPIIRDFTINNLATFTRYIISVQVFNPRGEGPSTSVGVKTGEGVSSAPSNFTAVGITDNSIRLKWNGPEKPNGIIRGYKIYIVHFVRNLTKINKLTIHHPENFEQVLYNLNPFTRYSIWIRAYNWKMEGDSSKTLEIQTDVRSPSAPNITNLTCISVNKLYLQWKRPQIVYGNVDYYTIYYRSENFEDFREVVTTPSYDKKGHATIIPNLTENTSYEVKVRGVCRSVVERSKLYKGRFSPSWKVIVQNNCRGVLGSLHDDKPASARKITDDVCFACLMLLYIVSFCIWR
ncbi:protein sidekick-2-like [Centruroides sculpturatus]|uniref:protein sidekick-2-like n=1 Tax=Centruroides sculpturatus TaxID=218467 RepID=UPI000C6EEADE|nr:protein sidekick-2-like [Centruroides sculpturatus]